MLQNRQSHRHSPCSVMSHVVLFAYPIKLNVSTKNRVTKILEKKLYVIFSDRSRQYLTYRFIAIGTLGSFCDHLLKRNRTYVDSKRKYIGLIISVMVSRIKMMVL